MICWYVVPVQKTLAPSWWHHRMILFNEQCSYHDDIPKVVKGVQVHNYDGEVETWDFKWTFPNVILILIFIIFNQMLTSWLTSGATLYYQWYKITVNWKGAPFHNHDHDDHWIWSYRPQHWAWQDLHHVLFHGKCIISIVKHLFEWEATEWRATFHNLNLYDCSLIELARAMANDGLALHTVYFLPK